MRALAPAGEVLFFAPPKKSTQKKGGPKACPLRGFPVLLGILSARQTRSICCACRLANPARQGGSLILKIPAMLGCANGFEVQTQTTTPKPVALTEYRRQSGIKARALSERTERSEIASCARPRIGEERRASALADECSGCPSLWVLSLGQARESISPRRAKPADKNHTCLRKTQQPDAAPGHGQSYLTVVACHRHNPAYS